MAARELRRRPGRAALTVLAVALAAALLCALLAIAETAKTRVLSQLSHGGSLAGILVTPNFPNPSQAGLDNPQPGPEHALTASTIAHIQALHDVSSVIPVTSAPVEVLPPPRPPASSKLCQPIRPHGGFCAQQGLPGFGRGPAGSDVVVVAAYPTSVVGVDLGKLSALPVTLLAGRLPRPHSSTEVDVGQQYVSRLGLTRQEATEVLGTFVELGTLQYISSSGGYAAERWVTVEIVGVVDQQAAPGDLVAWPGLVQAEAGWPLQGGALAGSTPSPTYVGAVVIADGLNQVSTVRDEIALAGYSSSAPVGLILSVGRYLHVVELVLSGIGIVALGIAALGIANALLAAVRERRREIGVLKAIGARDRDVLRMFLVEAGALGLVGGLLGTVLGIAMALAIDADANTYLTSQGLAGVQLAIGWVLPAGSVLGSAIVALAAGALPALRAARLPAREAVEA